MKPLRVTVSNSLKRMLAQLKKREEEEEKKKEKKISEEAGGDECV